MMIRFSTSSAKKQSHPLAWQMKLVLHRMVNKPWKYLELYRSGKMHMPDIIFLDLDMPIMNGYEFLEEFAKIDLPNKNAITIVVLTSSADPRDLARTKELGIKYYYNKPLSRDEIKKLIGQEFSIHLN